jgi:restriction system protein
VHRPNIGDVRVFGRVRAHAFAAATAGIAAYAAGAGPGWWLAAAMVAGLLVAPGLLGGFVRGAIAGVRTPLTRENPTQSMSGIQFEDYVATVARSCGVPVIMTPMTGDWGVDLIVGHRPNRLAIQCKRYSRPVGPGAIQEVVAGAPMQDCVATMVVSNQPFTPAAHRLAERHGCELVGGPELPALRTRIRRLTAPTGLG